MGHEIDLEGHRLRFVPSPRRCHRDLVLSGGCPAWWGCGPPAQPSALALQQPVHGGDTDGSCRTTVGRHGPHPGGIRIPFRRRKRRDGDPRRPISPTKAVSWLVRPDAHGVRLLTDLADRTVGDHGGAPDTQRGERGASGVLPAFSRSRWSLKPGARACGQPDSAPRTAAGGRRWSSIRAAVIVSDQHLATVRHQGGSRCRSQPSAQARCSAACAAWITCRRCGR